MDDSKTSLGLSGMSTSVNNVINDVYKLAGVVENTLLPRIQSAGRAMATMSSGGSGGGGGLVGGSGGNGGGNGNQISSSPGNFVNKIASSPAVAAAAAAAYSAVSNYLPGVPTAVVQDLLTQRSHFYGQGGSYGVGGVNSLQKSLAYNGTPTNSMDSTNALIAAQAAGLSGVKNFNQVMQGAATASNFTPGIGLTQATQAIGNTLNSANTVNLAKTIGINIRQSDGSMMPLPQVVDKIWNYLKSTSPSGSMTKQDIQFSMQPGYGIYNMLTGLFGGDEMMIKMVGDMLLAKATFGGAPVSSISNAQMVKAGIQSATIRNMAAKTAADTSLLTATSRAISGGFSGSQDIGTGMSNLAASMSDLASVIGGIKGFVAGLKGLTGKAAGGPTEQNVPYIVGEKGPELFVPSTNGTIIPNHIIGRKDGGEMTAGGFATQLLKGLGAHATPQALADVMYWEAKEGGNWSNTASFNPLNTSYQMKGSTNYNTHKTGGGVQAYNSWGQGLEATISTLTGQSAGSRGYTNIVDILKKGGTSTANFLKAMQSSSWDGGHYGHTSLTPSTASSSSAMSTDAFKVAPDPTAATRFAEAQARAFGGTVSSGNSSTNYNYGGISITINGSSDPKKSADEINKLLHNKQLLTQAGKK